MKRLLMLGVALSSMGTAAQCPWYTFFETESCEDFSVALDPQHCFELPVDPCTHDPWRPYAYFSLEQTPIGITVSGAFQGESSVQRICTSQPIVEPIPARFLIGEAGSSRLLGAGTVTLTGHPMTVHLSATPARVALGEYAHLGFTIEGGQPPYMFTWGDNGWFSDYHSETPFVMPFDTTTFTVTVVDHDGVSVTAGATVTVGLWATAEAMPESVSEGETLRLQARASGGDGHYTYQWSPSAGLSDATASEPYAKPAQSTIYTVIVTDGHSEMATAHVPVTVVTPPPALAAAFVYRQPSNARVPFDVALDASASTGNIVSYEWDLSWIIGSPDLTSSTAIATFTRTQESLRGTITLTVRDAHGSTATLLQPYP